MITRRRESREGRRGYDWTVTRKRGSGALCVPSALGFPSERVPSLPREDRKSKDNRSSRRRFWRLTDRSAPIVARYHCHTMCRSIQPLRQGRAIAPDDAIVAAARQYVRKVTGMIRPTSRHAVAFEAAVADIAAATRRALDGVAENLASGDGESAWTPRRSRRAEPEGRPVGARDDSDGRDARHPRE